VPDICLIWKFPTDFTEVSSTKIQELPLSGSRADACRRTEKRTDMMKVTDAFRESANNFKKEMNYGRQSFPFAGSVFVQVRIIQMLMARATATINFKPVLD
jgi:hypothetical protein